MYYTYQKYEKLILVFIIVILFFPLISFMSRIYIENATHNIKKMYKNETMSQGIIVCTV